MLSKGPFAPTDGSEVFASEFIGIRKKKRNEVLDPRARLIAGRQMARGDYVASRVALVDALDVAGCLLAHQCLEKYLKALIRNYDVDPGKTHSLRALVKRGSESGIAGLTTMLQDPTEMKLLDQLLPVYESLRFCEDAGYIVATKNVVLFLDQIVFSLEQMYSERLGEPTPPIIYVPESVQQRFLKHNDYWTSETISSSPNARRAVPPDASGYPPNPLPKGITLISGSGVGPLSGNIRFGSLVMKLSKEDLARMASGGAGG